MLIIEGADRIGKTTLAKDIAKELDVPYMHCGKPPAGFDPVWWYLEPDIGTFHVCDRFHLGYLVYQTIEGSMKRTPNEQVLLDSLLTHSLQAFTVVLCADPRLIQERWTSEEMFSCDHVLRANSMFADMDHPDRWTIGGVRFRLKVDLHIRIGYDDKHASAFKGNILEAYKEWMRDYDAIYERAGL